MFECGTCGKEFRAGWEAREQHCDATGHDRPRFECDTCDACFRNERALLNHMSAKDHFTWRCGDCGEVFPDEDELEDHEIDEHLYCSECDRYFTTQNGIEMHLNTSRAHREEEVDCPFCTDWFATATGMVHHLEQGACSNAPSLNRDEIYRFVRSKDPQGTMSKNLLDWKPEWKTTFEATDKTWNGQGYECYFCHGTFSGLTGLNAHLNSSVHKQELYHCPNHACRKNFRTLAALINHLESESCGYMRFETVQNRVGDVVSGRRLLGN